jgi:hypothetical protein
LSIARLRVAISLTTKLSRSFKLAATTSQQSVLQPTHCGAM